MIRYEEIPWGFAWGAAEITRLCSDRRGWVEIGVKTPKTDLQIYVTKTGKVRVWDMKKGELKGGGASGKGRE